MNIEIKDKIDVACEQYKYARDSQYPKFTKLGEWLEKESSIFKNETANTKKNYPKFSRGEIIKIDFGVNLGTELSNTHFAIVINSDDTLSNDNITVIPISSKNGYKRVALGKILKQAIPSTTRYNQNCYAMITQIKTVSKKRVFFNNHKYTCSEDILDKIDVAVKEYLTKC